jgi:osmoprotectant transport system substrate-binding protein
MRRIRLGGAAVAACLALLLAACGGGDDALEGGTQPNEQSSVTVGSTNFSEQLILAQMYAAVLEKAGVDVTVRPNLGAREVVFPALEKGDIDLLPEYNGSVLSFLNPDATQTTADEVNTALTPLLDGKGLVALEQSPAEDKDGLAVTQETADKYGLAKVSDLKGKASQLVIGGPPELETRPAGIPGLKKVYGIEDFKEFKALDAGGPLTVSALKKGDIDVGRVFTTQGVIDEEGWVLLEEDKPLQPAQNVVPIGRKDAMSDQVTQALDALSAKITTEELTKLNKLVDVDKQDPEILAAVEGAVRAQGEGQVVLEPRVHLAPPNGGAGHFNVLRGHLGPEHVSGVKVVGDFVGNWRLGLPSEPALVLLLDPDTGMPLGIVDATLQTAARTGAVTALGARYLARPDSRVWATSGPAGRPGGT